MREDRGQALAEFAVIATVLMLIVVGIVYFGRFLGYSEDMTNMANIAARWAAVGTDPGGTSQTLSQYVQSQASGELVNGSSDVTHKAQVCITLPSGSNGSAGSTVQATVTATFQILPFLNFTSIPATETATMRLEQQVPSSNILGCSS
jgi:Flp pilus assembly protein TadG